MLIFSYFSLYELQWAVGPSQPVTLANLSTNLFSTNIFALKPSTSTKIVQQKASLTILITWVVTRSCDPQCRDTSDQWQWPWVTSDSPGYSQRGWRPLPVWGGHRVCSGCCPSTSTASVTMLVSGCCDTSSPTACWTSYPGWWGSSCGSRAVGWSGGRCGLLSGNNGDTVSILLSLSRMNHNNMSCQILNDQYYCNQLQKHSTFHYKYPKSWSLMTFLSCFFPCV